ncbi:MAG TPA: pirin-like C-terminal cupin domain-containing protein, partial [Anaerolineales bacterium]|nr:pirin-like C-terminal cupin domain-containing protein [Anaerolineales bacterium]
NSGLIGPGDVQWMTSGRGILHEEMPRRGPEGTIYGFQLWVNLPAALKMTTPRYQEVNAATIPTYEKDGATIRVVAGQVGKVTGPVTEIAASPLYMDVSLSADTEWTQPVEPGHTALAYVFEGEALFADQTVPAVHMIRFDNGDQIRVKTENNPVRFMLFTGAPFKEPIFPYGPFVMNTKEEIQQALVDLRNGTFVK